MFNDFKIILDPPPHGFYTFEDNVSGKVIFESSYDEKVGWVYVFFHGWVNVEVIRLSQPGSAYGAGSNLYSHQKWGDKTKDKEILFQNHVKVYVGHDKLQKKTRYEWPFNFSFQDETVSAYNLPSSGHYSFIRESNWLSSVKYKVVAIHGEIGQRDDDIRWMLNPNDPRYLREPPVKRTGIFLKIREKLGGNTEQELKFVQIRASSTIDRYMPPANHWELYIDGKHVPQLAPPAAYEDLRNQKTTFPFSVDLQLPSNVVIGEPFEVQLSVSSSSNIWNQNPPAVILKSFKIACYILDITMLGGADEKLKSRNVWEGKRLNIPLSSNSVDIGKLFSFSIEGEDIIQSFDTRILRREYSFPVELTVEVGGKAFEVRYANTRRVTLLSPHVALGVWMLQTQPGPFFSPDFRQQSKRRFVQVPGKVRLQGTYIGQLSHDGAGLDRPLAEHSMIEAAIALSRTLTEAGIQHEFPGGTMIKLLPNDFSQMIKDEKIWSSGTDGENLRRLFAKSFRVMEAAERYPASLHIGMTDQKHRENISIEFPNLIDSNEPPEKPKENKKPDAYAMNLTPVILFNYRLWTLATHQSPSGEPEIFDIEPLISAFSHNLRLHRNEINLKFAKVAMRTHPSLADVLAKIGVDMKKGKGKEVEPGVEYEVDGDGEEQLPPYDPGWGRAYEEQLVGGMQEVGLRREETLPGYDSGMKGKLEQDNYTGSL